MLDSYSETSKPSNLAEAVSDDWHSAVSELNNRLLALESRFETIGAVCEVSQPQVEDAPVAADFVASVAVENAGAETPVVEQGAVNKSLEEWENAVVAM